MGPLNAVLVVFTALTCLFEPTSPITVTCHGCGIHPSCSSNLLTVATVEECRALLPNYIAVHFTPSSSSCREVTCFDFLYTPAREDSLLMYEHDNGYCSDLYIVQNAQMEVNHNEKLELPSLTLAQCFFNCTNNSTCVFFTYKTSEGLCSLGYDCGPRCLKKQDATDFDVYTVTCSPACMTLEIANNDLEIYMHGVTVGSVATYYCKGDTVVSPIGSTARVCQSDGTWSDTRPTCVETSSDLPLVCPTLSDPLNGALVMYPDDTLWAVYTCDTGYDASPTDRRSCQSDNTWTVPEPSCQLSDSTTTTKAETTKTRSPTTTSKTIITTPITTAARTTTTPTTVTKTPTTTTPTTTTTTPTTTTTTSTTTPTTTTTMPTTTVLPSTATTPTTTTPPPTIASPSTTQTTTSATTATPTAAPTTEVQPMKIYIMPCLCVTNRTFTNLTQEEIIDELIQATQIDTKATNLAQSKLISAEDNRQSAIRVGAIGIATFGVVGFLILLVDCLRVYRHFVKRAEER